MKSGGLEPSTLTEVYAYDDSSIAARTSAQLCNKITVGYNGTPEIHLKTAPSPLTITTPSNTPSRRPTLLTILKGIRIQSSVLPQYTFQTDRQKHTQTNRWARRQVRNKNAYAHYISDALTTLKYYNAHIEPKCKLLFKPSQNPQFTVTRTHNVT